MADNQNSGRGFAGMDEEKQREISRKGGESSHGGGRSGSDSSSGRSGSESGSSGRGSNLGQEDRVKGGENSHSNQNTE